MDGHTRLRDVWLKKNRAQLPYCVAFPLFELFVFRSLKQTGASCYPFRVGSKGNQKGKPWILGALVPLAWGNVKALWALSLRFLALLPWSMNSVLGCSN